MKFTVERDALLRALDHAQRIVLRKDAHPILNTVLISAIQGGVRICATNLDMVAETGCPADVEDRGSGCVPLDPLYKLLQRLPAGVAVSFEESEAPGRIEVRSRRSKVELPILTASDFPTPPVPTGAAEVIIDGAAFARLIGTPAHVAEPDSCYAFGVGVHLFRPEGGDMLCGIATNGKRVTRVLLPVGDGSADLPPVTLAVKPIAELVKLARAANGPVRLRVTENLLSAHAADVTITTKLIDTRFPTAQINRFFPASYDGAARVSSAEFDAALNRTLILADDQDRNVHCEITDGSLSIRTKVYDPSSTKGVIAEELDVEGGDGIGFSTNARMIREALDAIDADLIELVQVAPGQPIAMRAVGNDTVVGLVMPTLG